VREANARGVTPLQAACGEQSALGTLARVRCCQWLVLRGALDSPTGREQYDAVAHANAAPTPRGADPQHQGQPPPVVQPSPRTLGMPAGAAGFFRGAAGAAFTPRGSQRVLFGKEMLTWALAVHRAAAAASAPPPSPPASTDGATVFPTPSPTHADAKDGSAAASEPLAVTVQYASLDSVSGGAALAIATLGRGGGSSKSSSTSSAGGSAGSPGSTSGSAAAVESGERLRHVRAFLQIEEAL
jgi:hypothetical protein